MAANEQVLPMVGK